MTSAIAQSSASFGYSAEGKLLGVTSQRDSISLQWDALGRNSGKLINGDSYLFGYNGQGFLSSYSDPKGLNTQYSYNGFGFLTSLTSPDTGFTSFTTNLNGAPTQKATSGSVTNITYDAEDRISSKTVSHPTLGSLTYAYSYAGPGSGFATGNLTSISANGLSLSFEYDAFSQITKKTQSVSGSASLVTQYSYSSPNTLSAIGYHSGRVATYSRNTAGQVTAISVDGNTIVSNIKYSPYGVAGYTFANGNTVNRAFDLQGRITSVTLATGTRSYSYDARDNLTSISDTVLGNATYSYDYQNRLISANTALGQWGYSYDANGSRTQFNINGSGYAVIVDGASNKTLGYSTPTVRSLSYNVQGHVSQITGDPANPACGSNTQAAYNANGSLTSSNTFDAVYDDFGFRLRKAASACAGGSVTLFDYGPNGMLLGEYSNAGEAIQETIWLGDIPVAVFRGIKNSESPYFIYTDNLNTPRQIMTNSSQLVWSWDGEPFGATPANENVSPTTTFTYNLRFPGQYYDKESGLHQNRWREYGPKQGKYLQSDPLGLAAGVNTYAYVGSSPLMFVDPLGLMGNASGASRSGSYQVVRGSGDTSICSYYDSMASKYPNCSYYKEAGNICRGQGVKGYLTNSVIKMGIDATAARRGGITRQGDMLNGIRSRLIAADQRNRQAGNLDGNGCVCGNSIDAYHNDAFNGVGIDPGYYGGNIWPQSLWPNPVPLDPSASPYDPRRLWQ